MARHRFSCQHKGKGKFCHRCAQAEMLETLLANKQLYSPKAAMLSKTPANRKPWTLEEMANEAKRLRGTRSHHEAELSGHAF